MVRKKNKKKNTCIQTCERPSFSNNSCFENVRLYLDYSKYDGIFVSPKDLILALGLKLILHPKDIRLDI